MTPQDNTADNSFKGRLKATKTTRWIRFAIVSAIFVAWVAWMQSWWLLIFFRHYTSEGIHYKIFQVDTGLL